MKITKDEKALFDQIVIGLKNAQVEPDAVAKSTYLSVSTLLIETFVNSATIE